MKNIFLLYTIFFYIAFIGNSFAKNSDFFNEGKDLFTKKYKKRCNFNIKKMVW